MTRNLRALGLALLAVFAIGALAAQAEFTFTGYESKEPSKHVHTTITSTQTKAFGDEFRVTAGTNPLKCEKSTGEGTSTTGDDATVTIVPKYSGCESTAGTGVTVEPTSCHLRFNITGKDAKTGEQEDDPYTGTADVVCTTPGDSIHVKVFTNKEHKTRICEFTIEEQNGINGITYTNRTDKELKYVEVDVNSTNIKTTTTFASSKILCGSVTNETHKTGTFTGKDIVTGDNAKGEPINVTVSG